MGSLADFYLALVIEYGQKLLLLVHFMNEICRILALDLFKYLVRLHNETIGPYLLVDLLRLMRILRSKCGTVSDNV